jgi:hypothetical protein
MDKTSFLRSQSHFRGFAMHEHNRHDSHRMNSNFAADGALE